MPASTVSSTSLDVSVIVGDRTPLLIKRLAQSAFGRDFLNYDADKRSLQVRASVTARRMEAFVNLLRRYPK